MNEKCKNHNTMSRTLTKMGPSIRYVQILYIHFMPIQKTYFQKTCHIICTSEQLREDTTMVTLLFSNLNPPIYPIQCYVNISKYSVKPSILFLSGKANRHVIGEGTLLEEIGGTLSGRDAIGGNRRHVIGEGTLLEEIGGTISGRDAIGGNRRHVIGEGTLLEKRHVIGEGTLLEEI